MSIEPSELLDSLNKMREISMGNTPNKLPKNRITFKYTYEYDCFHNGYVVTIA